MTIQSEDSRNLLKGEILEKIIVHVVDEEGKQKKPTPAEVRNVAVILLGSSRKANAQYKEIIRKWKLVSPWRSLIEDLVNGSMPRKSDVVCHLRKVLDNSCRFKRRQGGEYMSPSCFVYLLDRLLVLVSYSHGHLFTTRSSVIEWLMHLDWKASSSTFAIDGDESSLCVVATYDFLANMVNRLLQSKEDIKEWVAKVGLDMDNSFQPLVLKLTIVLCLICLNSGKYLGLLNNVLSRQDVISLLPGNFTRILSKGDGSSFVNVLAQAMKAIDDPLVIIKGEGSSPVLCSRNAVYLNVLNCSKEHILNKLFGKNLKDASRMN